MDDPVAAVLSDLKSRLEHLYGDRLVGVYLFGSHARGTASGDSDIDVLVVLEGPVEPGREISRMNDHASQVCLRHDELVSVIPVSREAFDHRESPFYRNVREEARAV